MGNLAKTQVANRSYNAILGTSVRYKIHPALAGDGTATSGGVKISAGAKAWSAAAAVIAVNAIVTDYWVSGIVLNTAAAVNMFDIRLQDGAAGVLAEFKIDPTAVSVNLGMLPVPYPIFMKAKAAVDCRAGIDNVGIKAIYVGIVYATLL